MSGFGSLLEQLFRRGAMLGRAVHVRIDSRDFRLQRFDPRVELLDRHRVEVLAAERDERIVRLAREKIVEIHERSR